jgi:hypothetical protein
MKRLPDGGNVSRRLGKSDVIGLRPWVCPRTSWIPPMTRTVRSISLGNRLLLLSGLKTLSLLSGPRMVGEFSSSTPASYRASADVSFVWTASTL